MERGEHVTNPHEHVANPHEHVANVHEYVRNLHEYVTNLSECVANMSRAPTIMSGLRLKRYNVRVHRAAANKLNIETRAARGSVCNALLCRDSVRSGVPFPFSRWQFADILESQSGGDFRNRDHTKFMMAVVNCIKFTIGYGQR